MMQDGYAKNALLHLTTSSLFNCAKSNVFKKPVKQEVVEQPIKPKFNPKRKMISTSVGGVVVASVKLMASPEPKLSIYHGEDYMEESENLKIIVDKDRWAYTICLCIYNVSAQLSGQLSLVATNELGSDKCLLFIDVSDAGKLNIGELPSIECNVADRVDALIDEDVKLQFKVRSILPPEVWIEQNGVQLSPELLTVDTEGETTTVTFEIRKCKATDKAIYKCCVINKYGSSSFTVYLNVQTKVDQSPKTPTTPIEPTRLRRKNKPGSLTIPKEINSLYGDPSVKVSLTNVTTELSATNDYAATDSSSPIKEVMSATVSKSVDASHNRSRRKGASRYTFNYKRTQSAPAHQISGEMKEMEDELNASNKSSMDKDSEPASTNQHVLDELKKELDMAKIVDDVVDDKKSKKPPKIPSPQKDEVSHHIEEVSKTPIDSEVPKIEEGLQPKQMKNQSEQTSAPPKVKAKKTKTSKDETTQILADFNKTSIETQTMINAPEYPYSFVEHTTVPTKDKGVFEESSLTLPPDDYSAVDSEQQTKLSDQLEIEPIQEAIELPDASKSIKKRKVKKISEDLEKQTSIDFEFNRDENEEKELLMALNQKESETSHIKLSRSRLSEEDVLEQDLLEDAKRKQELKDKFGKDREEILDESDQLKDASKRLKKVPKDVKSKDEDILKPADFVDDQTDLESIKLDSADKLPKKLPKPETGDKEDFGGIQLKPVIKRSQKESESSEVESYKLKPTQFDEKSTIDDKDSISLKKVPTDQNNDERSLKSSDTSKSLKQLKKEQIDDDPKLKDDSKLPKSLPTIGDGGTKIGDT
ncbi:hypothetical protein M3Y97_00073100 [Aphelenchoides bicaudatus]|nr:hypothetical protein M3Y97_00073100 [Aphelenchoides bicaudatus]